VRARLVPSGGGLPSGGTALLSSAWSPSATAAADRRAASTRCPKVKALAAASSQRPMGSTYGTPRPDSPVATSPISSRSVRSAKPTSQVSPRLCARALAYETSEPATRQNRLRPASSLSWPPSTNHAARPPKTLASATRSMVESRNAPNLPVVPLILASVPSSMSVRTKPVQTITPANRCPVGNRVSAPADMPMVPMTVSVFGVTGVRARACATGVSRRPRAGRRNFSMAA
jgi:hypothetical protein